MKFFNLYINSSIHVALAVVAFYVITQIELELMFSWNILLFLFFATITGYNFVKYAGIAQLYHIRLTHNLKTIQVFSLASFFIMLYYFNQLDHSLWVWIGALALVNALYAIPVFKFGKNLRSIPLLKVFIIALVWTVSTVFIPLVESSKFISLELTHYFYGMQRFLMVICLMIPFEIRDVRFDATTIRTLPQVFGVWNTKFLGLFLLIICVFIYYNIFELPHIFIYTFTSSVLLIFILFSKTNQPRYFASFWVESIPIIYVLFNFILVLR